MLFCVRIFVNRLFVVYSIANEINSSSIYEEADLVMVENQVYGIEMEQRAAEAGEEMEDNVYEHVEL